MSTDHTGAAAITTSPAAWPASGRLNLNIAHRMLSRLHAGRLEVEWPDGRRCVYQGPGEGPAASLKLKAPAALRSMLLRGDLGFAESYLEGHWDSPDIRALLLLGALNESAVDAGSVFFSAANLVERLVHALNRNSRRGSRRNVRAHYDLGNEFYARWLDPGMTYSSGLFDGEDTDLEDAQRAKYRRLIELVGPGPGDHVLEVGCGWGGFAVEAARSTGCRVTGITLSRAQLDYARARVREAGLEDRIRLRLMDYRDLDRRFDHVVSIEMFEAVGAAYWQQYFDTVARCLRPGGRAAFQVITIAAEAFDRYRRRPDFIQRHVFPGGMLPSVPRFEAHAARAGLALADRAFFGAHYARTLAHWTERFAAARPEILAMPGFDERFERLWRYYLAYCEVGFDVGRVDLMQAVYRRAG